MSEPQQDDPEFQVLDNFASRLGEHYSEFVVVVKGKTGLLTRTSDRTWALGAVRRTEIMLDEKIRQDERP